MFGRHATPISEMVSDAIERGTINLEGAEDLNNFITQIQEVQKDEDTGTNRAGALNFLKINNGRNTIEFRIPNGTINPNTWIENVMLFGRLVEVSERLAQVQRKELPELNEEDIRLIELYESLKGKIPEHEKMENLLELLFSEEEREIYSKRYYENSELIDKKIKTEESRFGILRFAERVDFRKHTGDEFLEIAENNRGGYRYATSETRERSS